MRSEATTVTQYLAGLPEDRRAAISAVRMVILANLDKDYEEGMSYGMIGYSVPHRVYPAGYHCDPTKPLPFAGLASQKGHMSLYLMSLYDGPGGGVAGEYTRWFREAWAAAGKKLDMGKCCVRFKRLEDVSLDGIGEAIRRVPARKFIAIYEAGLQAAAAAKGKKARATAEPKEKAAKKRS